MKILLIEDDALLSENIKLYLEDAHFSVDAVSSAKLGALKATQQPYAVILLDWMLPDMSGTEVLRQIRASKVTTPVIMITARSQVDDKLEVFSLGVDDYVTKPFALSELLARVTAVIRRTNQGTTDKIVTCDQLTIDLDACAIFVDKVQVMLTPKEYGIIELLALKKGTVVSRAEILHHVWGEDVDMFTNHVDVHVKNLRAKVDKKFHTNYIQTVKGKGYVLTDEVV